MQAVFRKEINTFFSSLIGYIVIAVFLITTGLFIWVFPGNIFDFGYATLDQFFGFSPYIFVFLVPAITMRLLAEEKSNRTIEFLATKPISDLGIILGKFLAALLLFIFCLIPTLIYVYTIYQLATPVGDIDTGAIMGSYIGLILMGGCFVSIGMFASAITPNQIVAFVTGVFLCFFAFFAFEFISDISRFSAAGDYFIKQIGIQAHYESISRGVIDTRDVLYFITFTALFTIAAKTALESRKW